MDNADPVARFAARLRALEARFQRIEALRARLVAVVDNLAACAIRATACAVEFGFQLGPGPVPQFFLRFAPPATLHPHGVVARPVSPFAVRNGRIGLRVVSPPAPEAGIIRLGGIEDG